MAEKTEPDAPAFPLKITYETSLLTLITFLISIASLVWQIFNFFEGPQVRLIATDQITIGASDAVGFPNRDGDKPLVHFIARMSYVNAASAGYNAITRTERMRIRIDGQREFESQWFRFVGSDADGPGGAHLVVDKKSEAHPFPVMAGNAETHETLFQPWQKACPANDSSCHWDDNYVDWDTFIDWLGKKREIEFEFLTDIYGQKTVSATCIVRMSPERFADLKKRRWGSPVCGTP